jgi:hypothetical protein
MHIIGGEYPVKPGLVGPGSRGCWCNPSARTRAHWLRNRPASPGRDDYAVRAMRGMSGLRQCGGALGGWRLGKGVCAGALRLSQPGSHPGRALGRAGPATRRHRLDRVCNRRAWKDPPRRHRGGVRTRADRAVRYVRRRLDGRFGDYRSRLRSKPAKIAGALARPQ